jgi:hypothetical protein
MYEFALGLSFGLLGGGIGCYFLGAYVYHCDVFGWGGLVSFWKRVAGSRDES